MKRSMWIVAVLCLFLGAMQQAWAETEMQAGMGPVPAQMQPEKGPIGAVSFGYLYLAAQAANTKAWSWHQQGFYGIPQVNLTPWFGLIGDFVSTTNTGAYAHENIQAYLGGPIFTAYSKKKLSPFGFATAGKTRDSKAGMVTYSPAWAAGGGVTYKLNKHLALLFVPGEYVRNYPDSGPQLNNFTSRFGLVLPITK